MSPAHRPQRTVTPPTVLVEVVSPGVRGSAIGEAVIGDALGAAVGAALGGALGDVLGDALGDALGDVPGDALGHDDGAAVGATWSRSQRGRDEQEHGRLEMAKACV